ncbi:MAG: hypothetical protein KDC80_22550 [Saprospiraceae bacterium]|nr:hypothetical protein [Saprospiraceae bacterium]
MQNPLLSLFFVLWSTAVFSQFATIDIETTDFYNSRLEIGTTNLVSTTSSNTNAAHHLVCHRDFVINIDTTNIVNNGGTRAFTLRYQQDANVIDRGKSVIVSDIKGRVGIGNFEPASGPVDNPKSKLHIKQGDIYLDDINSGVIMKSPNGSCWRLQIDNNGQTQVSMISCPN